MIKLIFCLHRKPGTTPAIRAIPVGQRSERGHTAAAFHRHGTGAYLKNPAARPTRQRLQPADCQQ